MTETELEYQFCFNCNDRKNCYTKPKDCTRIKEEIGLQDMTNEEWLKSMNTEQLAEFLTKFILDDKRFRMTMVGGVNETKLWLKQPHQKE